jgi:hypothetical protein
MELEYSHEEVRYKICDVAGSAEGSTIVDAFEDLAEAKEAVDRGKEEGKALFILEERTTFSRRMLDD